MGIFRVAREDIHAWSNSRHRCRPTTQIKFAVADRTRGNQVWPRTMALLVIALLGLPLTHASAPANTSESAPGESATIASELAPQSCRFVAAYTQSREIKAIPQPLQSTGTLLYDCDQGLIWQTREPTPGSIVYTTSGKHFQIDVNNSVQQLNDLVNLEMAGLLLAMMGGNFSDLAEQFDIVHSSDRVVLTPRQDTTARFLRQIVIANEEEGAVITLVDGNEQHTVIRVDAAEPLPVLDPQRCSVALDGAATACRALLFPSQVAAGLTSDR